MKLFFHKPNDNHKQKHQNSPGQGAQRVGVPSCALPGCGFNEATEREEKRKGGRERSHNQYKNGKKDIPKDLVIVKIL